MNRALLLRVIAPALGTALCIMHLATARWVDSDAAIAWNGGPPPQYGWPLPWSAWNGVSSLQWTVAPLPFVFDLVVTSIALALGFAYLNKLQGRAQFALAAVSLLAGLSLSAAHMAYMRSMRELPTMLEPEASLWFGSFSSF